MKKTKKKFEGLVGVVFMILGVAVLSSILITFKTGFSKELNSTRLLMGGACLYISYSLVKGVFGK